MEERPSKIHISVSSIKEVNLTEGELKLAQKQGQLKRKSSSAGPVITKKGSDDVPTGEQSNISPESDIKRTTSLLGSKKNFRQSSTAVKISASSESVERRNSHPAVPAAKKRSSSVEQYSKTQSQLPLKGSKSGQGNTTKNDDPNDQLPKPSAEKVASQQLMQEIRKRYSFAEQHKSNSITALVDSDARLSASKERSGKVNNSKDRSNKPKSAGVTSKPENAQNNLSRKTGVTSSAPAGKRPAKDSPSPKSFSPSGMTALSPSSQTVKPSKSRQFSERRSSHNAPRPDPNKAHRTSSKLSRPADPPHPSSAGRHHRGSMVGPDTPPFADTPFPFHDTQPRTASVGGADSSWAEHAMEMPTPWGGLGSEAVAVLVATSSGAAVLPERRPTETPATKQRSQTKEQCGQGQGRRGGKEKRKRRSPNLQQSLSGEGEDQCLSLSVARAVTDERKRSFFTVLDDDVLEKLRERTVPAQAEELHNTLHSADETGSGLQLQNGGSSKLDVKRAVSKGRRSSSTNVTLGGEKGPKKNEDENVKEKVSGEVALVQNSKDVQSKIITLENPFKKSKSGKDSGEEDGTMKNVYESSLLEKLMASGTKNSPHRLTKNNTKQSGSKWKRPGLLKQLLGTKHPNETNKVLETLTEKRISLLIPQSLPDPRVINRADQIPAVGVSPIPMVPDSEAGRSQEPDSRPIQEEFFTSADTYRSSIAQVRQRLSQRTGLSPLSDPTAYLASHTAATSTEPVEESAIEVPSTAEVGDGTIDDAEEVTLADAVPEDQTTRSDWVSTSSSEMAVVNSDGTVSRRRKSILRRKRASSAAKHHQWKRKTSNKAYIEYQRRTDPRFHGDEDQMSHSTSLSLYPATSSEAATVDGGASWSEISTAQTASETGARPRAQTDGRILKCVTRATSTDEPGRTEGTQTSSTEYLLLDRRSCLVKVLAALQRLNTDDALQVARILRRSLDEDRVYEDISVKQILEPRRSDNNTMNMPLTRVESAKEVPKGSEPRNAIMPDAIPDQDYDELTRMVSQIDLMVRSKLRITAAPYSLIYETLINYHLEITQDYSPSVAVFNYYLTEQGHPLFDDTSGFFRPTILQVARESLYPRLYAHQPLGEPRELPAGGRLLDLQLLLDELLICPFCGQDVVWGQDTMCADFCCDAFAEVIAHEYEDDLGRIRRQAALLRRRAALGELGEGAELLVAALGAASSQQQAPAKAHCLVEKRTRLRALQRYGQDGVVTGKVPNLLPFEIDMVKEASGPTAADKAKPGKRKSRKSRRKSSGVAGEDGVEKKTSVTRRRSQRRASDPRRRPRTKRDSAVDDRAAGGERPLRNGKRGSRSQRKRSTKQELLQEVEKLQEKMGRRLTQDEIAVIMEGENVMRSDARGLSITLGRIKEKLDVTSLENIPDRGPSSRSPKGSRDFLLDEKIGFNLSSYMHDADEETVDTESTAASRRRGKRRSGGTARRARRKTRAVRDRDDEGSAIALDASDGSRTKRADRAERASLGVDDQLHYRLSESAFLVEGVTQLPWDGAERDVGGTSDPQPQLVTHPAERGERHFLQEHYPDGSLFITWFDDGSGHVMYPSGEPAILITVEPAGRRFVMLPDRPCAELASSNCVLAMFDPKGVGFVYSDKGEPRLLFDQREGWYHRDNGTIRRWRWSDLDDHVHHSPTLQPVIFAISRYVAVRVMRQDCIVLSFWANQRSVRFNVGVTAGPAAGTGRPADTRYRLDCQPSDHQELAELRDRVRLILGHMACITDEPVKYLIHHQKLLQRGLRVPSRQPAPRWLSAEPRRPLLPGGVAAGLTRRSSAAADSSARRALLLQQMALPSPQAEPGQPPPPPPPRPQSPTLPTSTARTPTLQPLQAPPTEVT